MSELLEIVGWAALLAGAVAYDRLGESDDEPERGSVEEAHEAYLAGEIDEEQLEERLSVAVDPDAQRIRDATERVDGVGPVTSAKLARDFPSVEAVKHASSDELEAVHGVGPSTARELRKQL